MSIAVELFSKYLESANDAECRLEVFANDAVFEFPYLGSIGLPTEFRGKEDIRSLLFLVQEKLSEWTHSNVVIYQMQDPNQIFIEYESKALVKATGVRYQQRYVSLLIAHEGKIKLLREYLNVIASARVLLPNGLADVQ